MVFKFLKLFGLDLPAKMEAAKSGLEQRIERATEQIKQVAQETAILAVLSVLAVITSAMAVAVGLIALYRWTADAYGEFAGLGVVGGILVVTAAGLIAVTAIKASSLRSLGTQARYVGGRTGAALNSAGAGASIPDALGGEPHPQSYVPPATATYPVASASDLVEPLTLFLGKFVKVPTTGNPTLDEMIAQFRATARGSANEAIDRAANVIRYGNRPNLVFVLTGTALIAWLLTHKSQQQP